MKRMSKAEMGRGVRVLGREDTSQPNGSKDLMIPLEE